MTSPPGPGRPGSPYGRPPYRQAPPGRKPYGGPAPSRPPYPPPPPYGHPPGGRAPSGQPGGFGGPPPWPPPPPPPRKSKAGRWLVLSVPAVGLMVFLITGLLAPGFLLGRDSPPASRQQGEFARPRPLAVALVDGVNTRDKITLHGLTCSDAPAALNRNIEHIRALSDARLTLVKQVSPTRAIARLAITLDGTRLQVRSDLRKEGGHWCWQDWNAAGSLAHI